MYLLSIVWPAFSAALVSLILVANMLYRFYVMVELCAHHSYVARSQAPFVLMGLVDTPVAEHIDEVDADDEPWLKDGYRLPGGVDGSKQGGRGLNYSAPRQMRTRYRYNANSALSFKTLRNMGARLWDNWARTDRKQR